MSSLCIFEQLWGLETSLQSTNSTSTPVSSLASKMRALKTLCGMKPQRQTLNTSKIPLSIQN